MKTTQINQKNEKYFIPLLPNDFGKEGNVLRIGVTDEDKAVGALCASIHQREATVSSIYVDPDYRRKGCGRMLMDALVDVAKGEGMGALSLYLKHDEGTEAFLREMDFALFEGAEAYLAYPAELMRSEKLGKRLKDYHTGGTRSLDKLEVSELRHVRKYMMDNKISAWGGCDPRYSTVHLGKEGVMSAMLANIMPKGLEMTCVASEDEDEKDCLLQVVRLMQNIQDNPEGAEMEEVWFIPESPVFDDMFAALEENTGYFRRKKSYMHGVRLISK